MSSNGRLVVASLVCTLGFASCSSEPSQPADAAVWQEAMGKDGAGVLDGRTYVGSMSDGGADTTSFQAVTTSASEGRIDWRGMIRGDAIEGGAIRSKPGQPPVNDTFRGTAQPAPQG